MNTLRVAALAMCLAQVLALPAQGANADGAKESAIEEKLMARLEAANGKFGDGDVRGAVEAFQALLKENLPVPVWGKVTFNLGIAQMNLKEYDEAIRTFESIFPSKVDDREPGGDLMEEFRNYRYRSCLRISACYERKGDKERALQSALLAKGKYKYQAHCGTCEENARKSLDAWMEKLKKQ